MRKVDVAIIGAGHAGLNALKEVKKAGRSWVLINDGPLGTTCARVGCMPSKAIIELAQRYAVQSPSRKTDSIVPADDVAGLLEQVRDIRDIFVDLVLANSTDNMIEGQELLAGRARFLSPDILDVNGEQIQAKRIIVATGSRSTIPAAWQALGDKLLTSDSLFNLEELPGSVAVIGLGPIGLEMGQALHRLGVDVTGFDAAETLAGITDPAINTVSLETFSREFPLHLGTPVEVDQEGDQVRVRAGDIDVTVDKLFVSVGRIPNIPEGLTDLCITDEREIPIFNKRTLQVGLLPIYLTGDANGRRMLLQDAAEEGKIAGKNCVGPVPVSMNDNPAMRIVFSAPNIAEIGATFPELPEEAIIGQQRFGPIGRALIMGQNRGLIRLYADHKTGKMLGASMVGPRVEHLAHLIAWSVQQGHTVEDMLSMPYYHPVIEEALQDALHDTLKRLQDSRKSNKWGWFGSYLKRRGQNGQGSTQTSHH